MSRIIHRCPFFAEETMVESPSGPQSVVAYQIVLWASIRVRGEISAPFPVILDPGHSHNFSIREEQLVGWLGIRATDLRTLQYATVNGRLVPLKLADVELHRNKSGMRDSLLGSVALIMPGGIAVHPEAQPGGPRLPLLGLRALVHNGFRTVIDGKKKSVSIGSGWFG